MLISRGENPQGFPVWRGDQLKRHLRQIEKTSAWSDYFVMQPSTEHMLQFNPNPSIYNRLMHTSSYCLYGLPTDSCKYILCPAVLLHSLINILTIKTTDNLVNRPSLQTSTVSCSLQHADDLAYNNIQYISMPYGKMHTSGITEAWNDFEIFFKGKFVLLRQNTARTWCVEHGPFYHF